MVAIAKVTAKGQTTIPQEIRAALNVKPGICWPGSWAKMAGSRCAGYSCLMWNTCVPLKAP